jgi:hypothetical protein
MARRLKLLSGLSTAAIGSALAFAACTRETTAPVSAVADGSSAAHHDEAAHAPAPTVATGGESEGAALVNVATDKAAYLSALQIVRGHLRAGVDLYSAGDRAMGAQHLRHPQAEILTTLAPAFAAFGANTIEPAIDQLATAGENGAAPAEINDLDAAALASIAKAGGAADASLKDRLLAVANTLTVAADEYSVAIKEGAMVNLHEYHDAYGFMATAVSDLGMLKGETEAENSAIAAVLEQARIAAGAAPSIVPPSDGFAPPSTIYGAAARIEIIARGL